MHQFTQFIFSWNSTCFGQFLCPSSAVYSLYTRHCYMSYKFEDSFWAGPWWNCSKVVYKPVWHIPVPSVQWINTWWWAEELPETCRVSCRSKFGKLAHLFGFIIKKFVTMHGHVNVKYKISLGLISITVKFLKSKILYSTVHNDDDDVITSTGTTELYCPDHPRIPVPAIQTTDNVLYIYIYMCVCVCVCVNRKISK